MTDIKDLKVGDIKHLDSTPPTDATPATSVMTLEAEIDATPQLLKVVRPYSVASKEIPGLLPPEAQVVMHSLFACFDRQKSVQEGLVGDVIWGFAQAGIPPELTHVGLGHLEKAGYIKFQAPDNTIVELNSDQSGKAWIRYQQKILDLIYEK